MSAWCFVGLHRWHYHGPCWTQRTCERCGRRQRYFGYYQLNPWQ